MKVFIFFILFLGFPINILLVSEKEESFSTYSIKENLSNGEVTNIESNSNHSLLIVDDGEKDHLFAWGSNYYGESGIIDDLDSNIQRPQEIMIADGRIIDLEASETNSGFVIETDEGTSLYIWGDNSSYQLGIGYEEVNEFYDSPQKIITFPDKYQFIDFDLGNDYCGLILKDTEENIYKIYTWGNNENNKLGKEIYPLPFYPILDLDFPTFTSTSSTIEDTFGENAIFSNLNFGYDNSSFLVEGNNNQGIYAWGDNNYSQLGLKININQNKIIETPTLIFNLKDFSSTGASSIKDFAIGKNHSGIILENDVDELYLLGLNKYGQLGNGISNDNEIYDQLIQVEINDDSIIELNNLNVENNNTSFIGTNKEGEDYLFIVGDNRYGQIGNQSNKEVIETFSKVNLSGLEIIDYSMGFFHNIALVREEEDLFSLYSWGDNRDYQLGSEEVSEVGIDKPTNFYIPLSYSEFEPKYIKNSFRIQEVNYEEKSATFSFAINTYKKGIFSFENYHFLENDNNVSLSLEDKTTSTTIKFHDTKYISTDNNNLNCYFNYKIEDLENHEYQVNELVLEYNNFKKSEAIDLSEENIIISLENKLPVIIEDSLALTDKSRNSFEFSISYKTNDYTNTTILKNHDLNILISNKIVNKISEVSNNNFYVANFEDYQYDSNEEIITIFYKVDDINFSSAYIYGLDLNLYNSNQDLLLFFNPYKLVLVEEMSVLWMIFIIIIILFILSFILFIAYIIRRNNKKIRKTLYSKNKNYSIQLMNNKS